MRFLGTFLEDPVAVPFTVLHFLAAQIDVADLTCVAAYRESEANAGGTRPRYAPAMATASSLMAAFSFVSGAGYALCAGPAPTAPSLLFDHASGWLIGHKVLLPGISILERFIAEIRSRMETRLWRLLVRDVGIEQQRRLDELLAPA